MRIPRQWKFWWWLPACCFFFLLVLKRLICPFYIVVWSTRARRLSACKLLSPEPCHSATRALMKLKLTHRQSENSAERKTTTMKKKEKIMFDDGEWTEKWTRCDDTHNLQPALSSSFPRNSEENSPRFLFLVPIPNRRRGISLHG